MVKGRILEAESVGEVLANLSLQQYSGLLRAECATNGLSLAKGEIYLLDGQPIYARTDKLSGLNALKHMLTWRTIRFSLISDAPGPPANLPPRIRIPAPMPAHTHAMPALPSRLPARSEIELLVPQRTSSQQFALSLPLTHQQRLIYFLIDGQRTIADLVRCSNKAIMEVEAILRELHHMGLIVVVAPNQ